MLRLWNFCFIFHIFMKFFTKNFCTCSLSVYMYKIFIYYYILLSWCYKCYYSTICACGGGLKTSQKLPKLQKNSASSHLSRMNLIFHFIPFHLSLTHNFIVYVIALSLSHYPIFPYFPHLNFYPLTYLKPLYSTLTHILSPIIPITPLTYKNFSIPLN